MLKQLFCDHRYIVRGGQIGKDTNVTYYECEKCGKEMEIVEKTKSAIREDDDVV